MVTAAGLRAETEMLRAPALKSTRWLRELVDYVKLAADKRKDFKTDFPLVTNPTEGDSFGAGSERPFTDALSSLTDGQMAELLDKGRLNLEGFEFSNEGLEVVRGSGASGGFKAGRGGHRLEFGPLSSYGEISPFVVEGRYCLNLSLGGTGGGGRTMGRIFDTLHWVRRD